MFMINNVTSGCKNCMVLVRLTVLHGMLNNIKISAKYVESKRNKIADSLSRLQFQQFATLARKRGDMDEQPTNVPNEIWPMDKIWLS